MLSLEVAVFSEALGRATEAIQESAKLMEADSLLFSLVGRSCRNRINAKMCPLIAPVEKGRSKPVKNGIAPGPLEGDLGEEDS